MYPRNSSLQARTKVDASQPFHIYYNISMTNQDQQKGEPLPKLTYTDIRNSPFIQCPDNFFVSVIRFNLETPSLPVWMPQVDLTQSDPKKLIYKMKLVNGSNVYDGNVNYVPSNLDVPEPIAPFNLSTLSDQYYFVYTVQQWITMLNNCLITLFSHVPLDAPFFYFDVNTSLLKLYSRTSNNPNFKLYFNSQLHTLLDSFQYMYEKPLNSSDYWYNILIYNNIVNNETINNNEYYVMKQESSTICLLNPISSIVFTVGLFPIQPTLLQPTKFFGSNTALLNNGNNSNLSSTLTDFEVAVQNANTYKENIQYTPSGEYRLIDLYGQSPVSTLELSVFWKDIYGNLHPFVLNSGCSANMLLMFRRKDFNSVDLDL